MCHDDQHATYRYGPVGEAPELALSQTIERLEFEPWSGVTREIGESVTFYSAPYSYTVVAGFERLPPSDDPRDESGERDAGTRHYGWVDVERNGQNLLHLECIPDSVDYTFGGGLYDLKVRTGQSWDDRLRRWMPEPD